MIDLNIFNLEVFPKETIKKELEQRYREICQNIIKNIVNIDFLTESLKLNPPQQQNVQYQTDLKANQESYKSNLRFMKLIDAELTKLN